MTLRITRSLWVEDSETGRYLRRASEDDKATIPMDDGPNNPDGAFWKKVNAWEPWFAWYPVRLLTMEWAWLRKVRRRPAIAGQWSYGAWDYANPNDPSMTWRRGWP